MAECRRLVLLWLALVCMQAGAAAQNASAAAGNSSAAAGNSSGAVSGSGTGGVTAPSNAGTAGGKKCSGVKTITQYVHTPDGQGGFANQTFTMAVHLESPFVYYNPEPQDEEDLLMGLTIDIARLLEKELNCKFKFVIGDPANPTRSAGALGAIGQIPGGPVARAQVAGGALHISVNNSRAVHFSLPYLDTGYILVIQTPEQEANWWGFTLPFHFTLWVAVGVEILIVAIACWLMEAPTCSIFQETDVVNGFLWGFLDSIYWSVTLLLQTPDKAPRTWGGKMVLVAHGWFMLIVIASYTANLASFLTAAEAVPILDSWSDVVESKGAFKLALPKGMSHADFIRVELENNPEANFNIEWTETWEEAFEKVRNGTVHATFHDEPVAQDFILKRKWQCELVEVGKTFNTFGYGFAFNYDSTNFIAYSQALVYLKETGMISELLNKYKIGPMESGALESCDLGGEVSESDKMSWDEMQGLLIMTGFMIIVGFIVNALERCVMGKKFAPCLADADAADGGQDQDVNVPSAKFSRRQAAESSSAIAQGQSEEDRQALAAALRAGVRAGVIEAIMKVAKENEHKVKHMEGNQVYKKQVKAMLEKGTDVEERVAKLKHDNTAGANPGEKALLGKEGKLDLPEEQLAEVHQVLAEWL